MTHSEYTKQVAIAFDEFLSGSPDDAIESESNWNQFIKSNLFKSIPEADEWIPISERLPECEDWVLLFCGDLTF